MLIRSAIDPGFWPVKVLSRQEVVVVGGGAVSEKTGKEKFKLPRELKYLFLKITVLLRLERDLMS